MCFVLGCAIVAIYDLVLLGDDEKHQFSFYTVNYVVVDDKLAKEERTEMLILASHVILYDDRFKRYNT